MVQNNQKPGRKYWGTRSFDSTAYSLACSALLASPACSAVQPRAQPLNFAHFLAARGRVDGEISLYQVVLNQKAEFLALSF